MNPTHEVTIIRDGLPIWHGKAQAFVGETHITLHVDVPLELVPDVPFVRLPKEDPDA